MLPTDYQSYIHISRYARWLPEKKRRETWEETVKRYIHFFIEKYSADEIDYALMREIENAVFNLEVAPSMRCLMTAGPALERDNVAGYNCAYVAVESLRAFDEAMYVLCCGTGVGFSVERQYVSKLPEIAEEFYETDTTIVVADSKIGWAKAYREFLAMLVNGQIPKWDVSRVRAAGEPLKTFGGRASGPEPLVSLFEFSVEVFRNAAGRKLTSVECHDLMCKVADIVVVGGVRRSALISLSNLTDERMRNAKSGAWWESNPQRALANNSVCYTEKPDMGIFMREWESLYESKSGERGIFNRVSAKEQAGRSGRRDIEHEFGTNPCSEIILRSKQFCNLTEVIVRPTDSFDDLKRKVRLATILGTLQSTLTNFRYLSSAWKRNTEEERLLGVSLTGIMDHEVLSGKAPWKALGDKTVQENLELWLKELKEHAVETNKEWADMLGIPASTAITCVKPSGTVSQLVNSSSGIHPRYSQWYIRTVRSDKKDPVSEMMISAGFPHEDDVTKPDSTYIFSFPMEAPKNSVMRNDVSAIEQLELWKVYQEHWCEHKPSITVYVKEEEWLEVGAWVYKHFDSVSGVSFLPHSNHAYKQAPYQEITEEEYKEWVAKMPTDIDWTTLDESEDLTKGSQELACTSGGCDIV
jgi:ribonucleoside-triphosphate reductase (thioredoxin)